MAGPTVKAEKSEGERLEALNPKTPLPRDPDNPGSCLTGVKGSDLINLLLRTLKGLMTIYCRLGSVS